MLNILLYFFNFFLLPFFLLLLYWALEEAQKKIMEVALQDLCKILQRF